MKVAVVILNYNSSSDCKKCIGFLKHQVRVNQEIIVVDNCSRPEDKLSLEQFCTDFNSNESTESCFITFIANNNNSGYNAGNNVGLRYAVTKGYEYALIANPDMEFPQEDYLYILLDEMKNRRDVAVLSSSIIGPDGKYQNPITPDGHWVNSFNWILQSLGFKRGNGIFADYLDNPLESHYCIKVVGSCFLIRLDFVESIEFFDEYPFLYCEEAILAKQVESHGKRMFYSVQTRAVHRHISSEKGNLHGRIKQWLRSRIYYIRRYSGYSFLGKCLSIISMSIYVFLLLVKERFLKRKRQSNS